MVISAKNPSGKSRIFMPLFSILFLVVAVMAARSVLAGCCANPALHIQGGYDTTDICNADPLIPEGECCPAGNDAYYDADLEWYPDDRADCLANYSHASSCDSLTKCAEGCCYDESRSGKYSDICYGNLESLCMLQSPDANAWIAGFPEGEQYESNPCYKAADFSKKLDQCPTISVCTQYETQVDCTTADEACYYCPSAGPTSGAGFCFNECDGNCLGEPVDYYIDNATTGMCEQPAGLELECGQQRCGAAEPACLCAVPAILTNSTHPFCCNVQSTVFSDQDACVEGCFPDCVVNARLEVSRDAYLPTYTKCVCGDSGNLRLDPPFPGYCCEYEDGIVYNASPCFDIGNLTGFVRDRGETGIEGASVSIAGLSTTTDPRGYYEFPELFIGTYTGIADHEDYGPDEADITITKGATAQHNFTLTALSGECTGPNRPDVEFMFTAACVRGEAAISLSWVNPCPAGAIQGFYLWRDGNKTDLPFSPATTSFVDRGLAWNKKFNYTLGVKYSFLFEDPKLGLVDTANYTATKGTGDARCAGITTEWGCLNETGGTGGKKNLLVRCTQCNTYQPTLCEDSVCVGPNHDGHAICLKDVECGALGNPFGLFATEPVCTRSQTLTPNACYFDFSPTVVDACYSCPDTTSCFDYRSENACTADTCLVSEESACRYELFDNVGDELGKGLCYQDAYNGTEYCHLCDDPLLTCDQPTCQDLGSCYLDNGRCLACSQQIECSDFETEETCAGGQDFTIDPDCPGAAIPSNNACGLMYCVWTGTECITDADGNGVQDEQIGNPPVTRVLNPPTGPVGKDGHLLELILSPNTMKTYYCVDDTNTCCPPNGILDGIPPDDPVAMLPPEGVSGTGEYFFRYYSKGIFGNLEVIKSMSFWLDVEGPMIKINYTVKDSTEAGRSDVYFDITLNKPAACTDELFPQYSPNPTKVGSGYAEHFTASYPKLPDTTYLYTVSCTDLAGNSASETIEVPVNRVDLIFGEKPVGVTTADTSKVLHVETKEVSACTVALLDASGKPGTAENMVPASGNMVHEKTKPSTESKRYAYYVKCVAGTVTDTTTLYFTADHLSPVTTAMFNSSNRGLLPLESEGWYRYVNILFLCKDPVLGPPREFGCQGTMHCVTQNTSCVPDNAETVYIDVGVAHGDNYTVCYWSTDGHNDESTKCTKYNIDKEPPETPELNDSSLVVGEPEIYFEGNRLMVSILAEDTESGVAKYSIALFDEEERAIATWKEFDVEQDKEDEWLTVWFTAEDEEWLEDEEGHKLWLTPDETYFFKGLAMDNVGLWSAKAGESDGVLIVPFNYTPEHCSNRKKDANEQGIDCGGGCPPCGSGAKCGNSKVEAGEECDGFQWGRIKGCKDLGFIGGHLSCLDCTFNTALCIPSEGSYCGDGDISRGEQCDDSNWGTIKKCSTFDQFSGGPLSCDTTCSYDTIGCYGGLGSTCGDEIIDAGEQCEGTTWGTIKGCGDFGGFTGGTLFCDADCMLDTTMCTGGTGSYCGNGVVDAGEQCDGDKWGDISGCAKLGHFTGGDLVCGPDCMFNTRKCTGGTGGYCGDGIIGAGEQCDGPTYGTISTCWDFGFEENPESLFYGLDLPCNDCMLDTSESQCTSEREGGSCGDGIVDPGEQCDSLNWAGIYGCTDFGFTGGQLVCKPDCRFDTSRCTSFSGSYCGNGVIDAGEQCDGPDWGRITGCTGLDRFSGGILACGTDCRFNTRACFGGLGSNCGDGVIDAGEQCDGSEWGDIGGCRDIGEFSGGTLSCSNDCRLDTTLCTSSGGKCGDGVIDSGEQCDGSKWGDITGCKDFSFTGGKLSCTDHCRFSTLECTGGAGGRCGDGVIDAGEVCDGSTFGPVKKCLDLGFLGGDLGCTGKCHFDTSLCEAPWQTCIDDIDCESMYCNPDGFCSIPTCFDGWQNNKESGVDCGGSCKPCELDVCSNGVKDSGEKGIDCGGICSAGCPAETPCTGDEDCESKNCVDGICAEPSCSDGIRNGAESDVDCGRACTPDLCVIGKTCKSNKDCVSGSCYLNKCVKSGEGGIDEEEEEEEGKGKPWLKIIFFILLLVLLGAGGYFGYTKYIEAKQPTTPAQPGMMPGAAPARPMLKKRELSPREQKLLSRRRMEEKKKERGKMFEAFKEGGEKPGGEKPSAEKPADPGKKQPLPKKEDAKDVFSAFDSGPTGVGKTVKTEKKEEKPEPKAKPKPKPKPVSEGSKEKKENA